MDQAAVSQAVPNGNLTAILVGGFIAGAIDISYAIISSLSRVAPERILQSVASGLLGRDAFEGGAPTALLGLVLHFAICTAIAAIFVSAARALPPLRQHLIAAGIVYGASVYFVMRWVVVPLSRFPGDLRIVHPLEIAVHAFGVGLVIALAARRFAHL